MKFYLIFAVSLSVPLVAADWSVPTAKILLDGDFVLTESYDARDLQYEYEGNLFIVQMKSNDSKGTREFMHLKKEHLKENSFAIETFEEASEEPNQYWCLQKSSEKLRSLIDKCYAKIVLRELTDEERKQIQEFKDKQEDGKTSFKLVYKKKSIQTWTAGLLSFNFNAFGIGTKKDFTVYVNSHHPDRKYLRLIGILVERSFVIEDLPVGRYKCRHTGLPDLMPVECNGQIKLRELTADD